jgi:hypothetical protein
MSIFLEKHPELRHEWQLDILVIEAAAGAKPAIIHYENIYLDYLNE